MSKSRSNKFRAAMDVLQKGRDILVDELAETVLDQSDDLIEGGYAFHEFLENQGTRLHFLCLLLSQLEQSAEALDEMQALEGSAPIDEEVVEEAVNPEVETLEPEEAAPAPPARKRRSGSRSRGKKLQRQSSPEDA